jgi:hypothetical protein
LGWRSTEPLDQDGAGSIPWRVSVARRAFEGNAKSVTAFDTITQETINRIH